MTDEEYAIWLADAAAAAAAPASAPEDVANAIAQTLHDGVAAAAVSSDDAVALKQAILDSLAPYLPPAA